MSSPLQNNITNLQNLLQQANSLPEAGGVELPELSNPAVASELFVNKELIDGEGNVVTGTFSIDEELTTQDDLISQIQIVVDSLPEACGAEPILQEKTVTPTTSTQTIIPDSGYDGLSEVTVNAIPSSYVKPTSTKGATTYTPTTSNQTISAGTYCSGIQTIKGDANLIAENIVSGKSIFGIIGTAESGGNSGSGSIETCTGTLTFDAPPDLITIYYINSAMQLSSFTAESETTFNPIKNSIIYIDRWNSMGYSNGSAELIEYETGKAAYYITGNFTLIYC